MNKKVSHEKSELMINQQIPGKTTELELIHSDRDKQTLTFTPLPQYIVNIDQVPPPPHLLLSALCNKAIFSSFTGAT